MNPLSERDRFKRRILRGAVDDNLEALKGEPAGTRRRRREHRNSTAKRTVLIVGTIAAAVVSVTMWLNRPQTIHSDSQPAPIIITQLPIDNLPADEPSLSPTERLVASLLDGEPEALLGDVIPLSIGKVAIDPGHGGRDGGTSLRFGLLEKDLTRDIADRLEQRLNAASVKTVITRIGDETTSLKARAEIANRAKADIFISIHVNWLPNRHARGVETYFLGTTDDPLVKRIAASENQGSGYSMADYRHLLEAIYADVRQSESRRLAYATQTSLFQTLQGEYPQIVSRGVLRAPFVVLVATEMPAILAEVACLSNDTEARLLAMPTYRQRIADALFAGIISYSNTVGSTREVVHQEGDNHEQGNESTG